MEFDFNNLEEHHHHRLHQSYFETFTAEEIKTHVLAISKLQKVKCVVHFDEPRQQWLFFSLHNPYLYSIITGVLSFEKIQIVSGGSFHYKELGSDQVSKMDYFHYLSKVILVFKVEYKSSAPPAKLVKKVQSRINQLIEIQKVEGVRVLHEKQNVELSGMLKQFEVNDQTLYPIKCYVKQRSNRTELIIIGEDTPAFLFVLFNSLNLLNVQVQQINIQTNDQQVKDILWIVDRYGKPIEKKADIERIKVIVTLIKQFTHFLPSSSQPDKAIQGFYKFINNYLGYKRDTLVNLQHSSAEDFNNLAKVFSTGMERWESFARIQMENLLPMLTQSTWDSFPDKAFFQKELEESLGSEEDFTQVANIINEYKDKTLFKADLYYLTHPAHNHSEFSECLCYIAEVAVGKMFSACYMNTSERHGRPMVEERECQYSVLALGKLGSLELGYGSDLELMIVFEKNEKTYHNSKSISNQEFFNKVVQLFLKNFKAKANGIFEVDLRLRPHGETGPLSSSYERWVEYFDSRELCYDYERQALARMRPIMGEDSLNEKLMEFRKILLFHNFAFDRDVHLSLRQKQIDSLATPGIFNAKYSPGGLVELEYALQYHQIKNGAKFPGLETTSTQEVLTLLLKNEILSPKLFEKVSHAYSFIRRLINQLRISRGNAKDLNVPAFDTPEFNFLMNRMGYHSQEHSRDHFLIDLEKYKSYIHQFYNYTFKDEKEMHFELSLLDFLDPELSDEDTEKLCAKFKVEDEETLKKVLERIMKLKLDRQVVYSFLVQAEPEIIASFDFVTIMRHIEQFFQNTDEVWVKRITYNPQYLSVLFRIFNQSKFLARTLINNLKPFFETWESEEWKYQKFQDEFKLEIQEEIEGMATLNDKMLSIRKYRNKEYLRIALRDFYLNSKQVDITREISDLSYAIVDVVYHEAFASLGFAALSEKQVVIAFGKLGGRELNYSSDIDIVFVYAEEDLSSVDKSAIEKGNNLFMRQLVTQSVQGQLFRVDTRLRPYGDQGALISTWRHYEDYYLNEAHGWELQIWLKANVLAGNQRFGEKLITRIHKLTLDESRFEFIHSSIKELRVKVLDMLSKKCDSDWEVKSGPGGIRNVEFLVQKLQLQLGNKYPELVLGNTILALKELYSLNQISESVFHFLKDSYEFLRRIEHVLQLDQMQQDHYLNNDDKSLDLIARRINLKCSNPQKRGEMLREKYLGVQEKLKAYLEVGE